MRTQFLVERGGRWISRDVLTPPNVNDLCPPLYAELVTSERVLTERDAARADAAAKDQAVVDARAAKRQAIAAAAIAGDSETVADPVPAAIAEATAARERLEGLELAAEQQARTVRTLVETHRQEFVMVATAKRDAAAAAYHGALNELLSTREAFIEAEATVVWASQFPTTKRLDWSPVGAGTAVFAVGGDLVPWSAIEDGLRRDADPVERKIDPNRPRTMQQEVARIHENGAAVGPDGQPAPQLLGVRGGRVKRRPATTSATPVTADGALIVVPGSDS